MGEELICAEQVFFLWFQLMLVIFHTKQENALSRFSINDQRIHGNSSMHNISREVDTLNLKATSKQMK